MSQKTLMSNATVKPYDLVSANDFRAATTDLKKRPARVIKSHCCESRIHENMSDKNKRAFPVSSVFSSN